MIRTASENGNPVYDVDAYTAMVVRNLFGGDASCPCEPLKKAVEDDDREYIAGKIAPIVQVIVDERDTARADATGCSARGNDTKFVLEYLYQNLGGAVQITDTDIRARLESIVKEGRQ